ncbi:S24 family peptidase [Octadecabacter sp. G9-8]|uniref:S24 family peptidase n=1 Tax=Octadecabacter dasysiphoniae TaxID=2909341 RepID=A0ABS9D0G2_9RHOB|nr:S24 family peptidase [Octadecabacter dasysiphoniae]
MKDILDIIDSALSRKGLSAAAASRLAVGNPSLIKNMRQETGNPKRFNADALRKLADVLDLEFYFGEERENTIVRLPAGFAERTVQPLSSARMRHEALEMGFLPIPYHAAAAPDFRGTAPVALARQWLTTSGVNADTLAFLPVINDDMVPTLTVGTLALIDTAQKDTSADGIWAFSVKGSYVFARVQSPSNDMMLLKGDKPDQPVQIFKGDELATLKVLGRVVWIVHQP